MNTINDIALETIGAMLRQEANGYQTCDYLHQDCAEYTTGRGPLEKTANCSVDIDEECRRKVVLWCYQMVDFVKFNRETVAIAINILDRFVATSAGLIAKVNQETYQLAAMTSLYTAAKIHEPEAMDPKMVSRISRNLYSPREVEAMEVLILQALAWRVNPPTAMVLCSTLFGSVSGI